MGTHVWTLPKTNICVDQTEIYTKPKAIILAISREKGLETVMVFEKSINKQKFKNFLDQIRSLNPFENVMLMMDNLKLHKAVDVK